MTRCLFLVRISLLTLSSNLRDSYLTINKAKTYNLQVVKDSSCVVVIAVWSVESCRRFVVVRGVVSTNSNHHQVITKIIKVGLVESFGRFSRLLKPGFNLINPCADEVTQVDLRIKTLRAGRHVVITKDNVNLTIEASIAYRVVNPIISHYILGNQINHALV